MVGGIVFVLLYALLNRNSIKLFFKRISLGLVIGVGVNLWWLLPLFLSLITSKRNFQSSGDTTLRYVGLTAQRGGLLTQLLLHNTWAWGVQWGGRFFQSFSPTYEEFWPLHFVWLSVVLFALTVFMRKKKHFIVCYAALILILSLFFAKGIQAPLGVLFEWLYTHIPFFWAFRSPDTKFGIGIVFGLAILLSFSMFYVLRMLHSSRVKFFLFSHL